MPNWVTNKVKFKSRGREIIDKIISTNEQEEEYLDFNKIIPRPKTLDITSGGNDKYAMQYALLKMNIPKLKETIKTLGVRTVTIKLHEGVIGNLKIDVISK